MYLIFVQRETPVPESASTMNWQLDTSYDQFSVSNWNTVLLSAGIATFTLYCYRYVDLRFLSALQKSLGVDKENNSQEVEETTDQPPPVTATRRIRTGFSQFAAESNETDTTKDARQQTKEASISSQQSYRQAIQSLHSNEPFGPYTVPPGINAIFQERVPQATKAERQRFYQAYNGDYETSIQHLTTYLDWHLEHQRIRQNLDPHQLEIAAQHSRSGNEAERDDWNDWNMAATVAQAGQEHIQMLPRIVRMIPATSRTDASSDYAVKLLHHHAVVCGCRDQCPILVMWGAKIDPALAPVEVYAVALALYLDMKLSRLSQQKVTVWIDVRGGPSWCNVPALKLLGFIKTLSGLLTDMFPERLNRSIVFPVPGALAWIWGIVKRFLDPVTAAKFVVIRGSDRGPCPSKKLQKYIQANVVAKIEQDKALDIERCGNNTMGTRRK